jgi:hypothetical protein
MFRGFALALGTAATLASAALPVRAQELPPTITILEGEFTIYRGANRLIAAEGTRLATSDIIETGATTFTQIEMPDKSIVQFGPGARAMLGAGGSPRSWYLMTGWVKLSGVNRDPKAAGLGYTMRAPLFDMPAVPGVVVLKASPGEVALFIERGDLRLAERQSTTASTAVPLKANDFYVRKSGARGVVSAGPAQPFLAEMPKSYRDSLPARIDRYRDRDVRPKEGPAFAYADVELWLKGEPNLRRQFVQRFRGKAATDNAFRQALVTNLASHFEWDPILFPEKYLPKDPPQTATPGTTAVAPPPTPPGR